MKQECPFCHKKFTGVNLDGVSFYDEHLESCDKRIPPDINSKPIQTHLDKCLKCGGTKFRFICHYDEYHPRRALWTYACVSCGQHHTVLSQNKKIASNVPYNPDSKQSNKPIIPKWDK